MREFRVVDRPTLLIVHGDPPSSLLAGAQLADAFVVNRVSTSEAARRSVDACPPAVVLFDSSFGDSETIDLCRVLRSRRVAAHVPIIVVCDQCSETDRIAAYQSGADDYFCGPWSSREMRERILAVVRRARRVPRATLQSYRGDQLVADFEGFVIRVQGTVVDLTRREFDLLHFLIEHRNRVLSRQELLDSVWQAVSINDRRTVDTHIRRLRAKLGAVGRQIQTLPGRGYRFVEGEFGLLSIIFSVMVSDIAEAVEAIGEFVL